jgi:hypothetical protein
MTGMVRTIAIWVFGLLASAIVGGLIASALDGPSDPEREFVRANASCKDNLAMLQTSYNEMFPEENTIKKDF